MTKKQKKQTEQETTSASMEKPEPMTETTRPAQKPEETGKGPLKPQKIRTRRLQDTSSRQPWAKTRSGDDDDDAGRDSRHATDRRSTRRKQETDQKPTDRKKPPRRHENMH